MDVARYRNIATEGALLGSLKRRGVAQDLAIISDDAGQFNVLIHGLCWVQYPENVFIWIRYDSR